MQWVGEHRSHTTIACIIHWSGLYERVWKVGADWYHPHRWRPKGDPPKLLGKDGADNLGPVTPPQRHNRDRGGLFKWVHLPHNHQSVTPGALSGGGPPRLLGGLHTTPRHRSRFQTATCDYRVMGSVVGWDLKWNRLILVKKSGSSIDPKIRNTINRRT